MTGIIDIGSNTIRLVIYKEKERIANFCEYSNILADTVGGELTDCGIERLCDILFSLRSEIMEYKCGVFAFATSAFRDLKNQDKVKQKVFEETGLCIDVLSGEREAEYDLAALLETFEGDETGIGVDLGGGSCQIFAFEREKAVVALSLPIGCKRIKRAFCKTPVPEKKERKKIEECIKRSLSQLPKYDKDRFKKLYMMGGTIKTAENLYEFLYGTEIRHELTTGQLEKLLNDIEEGGKEMMEGILKKRYETIAVGLIISNEIAKFVGTDIINIKKCCVRDGYLAKLK